MNRQIEENTMIARNLNTMLLAILSAILLPLVTWIAYTVQETSKQVAVVIATQSGTNRDLLDMRTRITATETRLTALELEMAQIRARSALMGVPR